MTPAALAALHARCFETPRPWSEAEFSDMLDGRGVFLVHNDAGFALGRVIADEAELLTIAVASEARRAGRGAALMAEFLAVAISRGARIAHLEVSAENAPAIALYRKTGFAEAGRRRGYYRTPDGLRIDALAFTMPLG